MENLESRYEVNCGELNRDDGDVKASECKIFSGRAGFTGSIGESSLIY